MIRPIQLTVACFAVMVASGAKLQAGVILSPDSVVNNTMGSFFGVATPDRTHNQSGIDTGFLSGVDDFDTYMATNPVATHTHNGANSWFSALPFGSVTSNYMDFDLDGLFRVEQIAYWGVTPGNGSVRNFQFWTSDSSDFSGSIAQPLNTFATPTAIVGLPSVINPVVADVNPVVARFVRLEILSVDGDAAQSAAIGEIAFNVTAVPEPSSLAILGVGACAFAARRRRRAKTQVATA